MIESIQLLTITTDRITIGMDSTEIEKALLDSAHTDRSAIEAARKENRFYSLTRLLNIKKEEKDESFLVVKPGDGRELMIAFTGTVDFKKIGVSSILAIPPYIQRKQNPLFVWGFVRENDRLITLVTFCFLASGGTE